MLQAFPRTTRCPDRRGFSLVETTIAMVLVGGLYITALNLVGASQVTQARYTDREQGLLLAESLLNEIRDLPYEEPDDLGSILGIELGEAADDRTTFDDVDDYDGWSANPPVQSDGTAIPGTDRYTRSVAVTWVDLAAPKSTSTTETGVKRITVTISTGTKDITTLTGYIADAWPHPADMVEGDG